MVGAIIGKNGTSIRRIQIESGAEITIMPDLSDPKTSIISVKGSQDQIQNALHQLQLT